MRGIERGQDARFVRDLCRAKSGDHDKSDDQEGPENDALLSKHPSRARIGPLSSRHSMTSFRDLFDVNRIFYSAFRGKSGNQ